MAAGMGAGWASTPMDVVKTRIQVGEHDPSCWDAVLGPAEAGGGRGSRVAVVFDTASLTRFAVLSLRR